MDEQINKPAEEQKEVGVNVNHTDLGDDVHQEIKDLVESTPVPPSQPELNPIILNVNKLLNNCADFYNTPRVENEIDLVKHVRESLIESGAGDLISNFDESRFVIEAVDKTGHAQQFNLTRFFDLQLSAAPIDTSVERYALLYSLRADEWLGVFKNTILPTIVDNQLLKKI